MNQHQKALRKDFDLFFLHTFILCHPPCALVNYMFIHTFSPTCPTQINSPPEVISALILQLCDDVVGTLNSES